MSVKERYQTIQETIRLACAQSGRSSKTVKVIAVTKYVSVETTEKAIQSGISHIGENRIEGLNLKQQSIKDNVEWHFIGSLQSRKVKDVIHHIDYLHSLDRISLAEEIEKRADNTVKCFIQVNVSGEPSKHGISPENLISMVHQCKQFSKIQIVGLMTMAPYIDDENRLRAIFRSLKELQTEIQQLNLDYAPCDELSMGMSNDYHIAVEEGATFVRIGTALVGKEK